MQRIDIDIRDTHLHIPVRTGRHPRHALQVCLGGTMVREFYLSLAGAGEGAHFFFDVSAFSGKTLTLIVPDSEGLAPDALRSIVCGGAPDRDNPLYPGLYEEPLRAQYHFSSKRGWLNDPNGLVYAGGQYHLYYQHNPMGVPHGGVNICWGHAVSDDLLHWTERNDAIAPWRRDWSVASGSALVDRDGVAGWGEGAIIAAFTALGTHNEIEGRGYASGGQFMAASTDGGDTFHLFNTQAAVPTERGEGWRDPRLFRFEDHFVMAVYEVLDGRNCVSFYTSNDLHDWTRTSRNMDLYECPDVFPLTTAEGETRWVLYGADGFARIGEFDGQAFTESGDAHPLDYGKAVYAGQTWSDHPEAKRVHISWIFGMDGYTCEDSFPDSPFSQCMSIPCELTLVRRDGHFRVLRNPVSQLEALRQGDGEAQTIRIDGDRAIDLSGRGEYLLTFAGVRGPLTLRCGEHEIAFDPEAGALRFDRDKTCALPGVLSVRLLVDTTTMECFFGDGIAATYTMHPSALSLRIEGQAELALTRWALQSVW